VDQTEKELIKLLAQINVHNFNELTVKPTFFDKSSLYCFEIFVTTKIDRENVISVNYFFDCINQKIYIEDYGSAFSSIKDNDLKRKKSFQKIFQEIYSLISQYPKLNFIEFQTTSRIPESFNFLLSLGFEQKEQLNHYGNFKFIFNINKNHY
jgi:hypothetical protein